MYARFQHLRYSQAVRRFDRKFGADFLESLPTEPGVYLFRDDEDNVLYVGKAKNLRRRLATYRLATNRRKHRKMRILVQEAARLEIRPQATEERALLLENELIRDLAPPFNVDGAYAFLYPAIGIQYSTRCTLLCFTTEPAAWTRYSFRWFGVFRSRRRAKQAFDTLVALLSRLGHLEPTKRLGPKPLTKGSRLAGVRRLDAGLVRLLEGWLAGDSPLALARLAERLLERPGARREAELVESQLRELSGFYRRDLRPLHEALRSSGRSGTFVSQDERDGVFIRMRTQAFENSAGLNE